MDGDDGFRQDTIQLDRHRAIKTDGMINAKTRAMHEYWEGLRAGRLAPLRTDIDPRKMPCDVRHVFILEVLSTGNIRFRVAGSALVEAFGMELRGMNARSIMAPESRESFSALMNETLEDPGVGYARLVSPHNPNAMWEISLLPLRSDFGAIDRLIGVLVPVSGGASRRNGPLQFRIDAMQVESVSPSVVDAERPAQIHGFGETLTSFEHDIDTPKRRAGPRLHSIDGGLNKSTVETEAGTAPRGKGHLRLVDD